jgi:hypothetical protein
LLKSATQIIQDTFGIKSYHNDYGLGGVAFSPTVYEMIKRYEFLKNKHKVKYEEGLVSLTRQQAMELTASLNDRNNTFVGLETRGDKQGQNANLSFRPQQLAQYDEIPLQKKSMFEKMVIVRDPDQFFKCSYMSDFMKVLNDILQDGT